MLIRSSLITEDVTNNKRGIGVFWSLLAKYNFIQLTEKHTN